METKKLKDKVDNRRTFAIISHPDAGKTTMTEQLLLFGGVVRKAGTVKGKKGGQFAKSDWMKIEQQRGISVTSSVMQFDYNDKQINILDTPGHEDFSEDTYRTLMAVDSAVMVIDAAKGIEQQTKKLFQICRQRHIPIFAFINKMDRDSRDPLDLITELEETLGVESYPMNWPIGSGKLLKGLYDRYNNRIELYKKGQKAQYLPLDDNGKLNNDNDLTNESIYKDATEQIYLLKEAGNEYNKAKINNGTQIPVFFGSALTDFGVKTFLDIYLKLGAAPSAHHTTSNQEVSPLDKEFSGFVFKIQANMNPNHRDRIAFVRVCSGTFKKGMDVELARTKKKMRLSNVTEFMANNRENVQEAVAGDIIGLYDTGNFQIGDSIFKGKDKISFQPLPQFTPELFMRVTSKNVMKQKSFHKGIKQLAQEGAIQLYRDYKSNDYILGAVGKLQFDVFKFRMKNEYNSEVLMTNLGHKIARWIDPEQLDLKLSSSRNLLVKDLHDAPLYLFESKFAKQWFEDHNPKIKLKAKL